MRPFWIRFEQGAKPAQLGLGAGVTAYSEEDARTLAMVAFGAEVVVAGIKAIQEVGELDQGHVVPNMDSWFQRGVWYPKGYR